MYDSKKELLKELKNKKSKFIVYHSDIPEEYTNDIDIKIAERGKGIRKIEKIGFDIIKQKYFVYEECKENQEYQFE